MIAIKKILKGKFARNVLMIAGGTAFAQALDVLATPVITRIYTPEQYGVLTVYTSLLVLFSGSQSFRYELGIPIADDDEKAINILGLSLITLLILSTVILCLVLYSSKNFFTRFLVQQLYEYRLLVPLGFFLLGLYQIFMMWGFRKKDFKSIAKTKTSRSIGANVIKIVLGMLGFGSTGLLLGKIFGESVGITTLSRPLLKKDEKWLLKKITIKDIFISAKRYVKFPIYSLPSTFLSKVGDQIPVLFIASLYGGQVVGYYGLAKSMVTIPTALIGNSIGDVFYSEAATLGKENPKRLKSISIEMFKKLFFISIVPLITFLIFSPTIFKFVFGESWYEAGLYARILSIWAFSQLIFQPASRVYDIFERQKELFIITMTRVILIVAMFGIAKLIELNSYVVISLYVFIMFAIYATTYLFSLKIIKN